MTHTEALADPTTRFRVEGAMYVASTRTPVEGDLVIDKKDGLYGWVETIIGNRAAVKQGFVVELAVPLKQLVVLTPAETKK